MSTDTQNALTPEDLTEGREVGDYKIGKLIYQGKATATWHATQVSVQREVIICNLYGEQRNDPTLTEPFLEDVRAKATVDHPLISSVLEAIHSEGQCFFAREKLPGQPLSEHYEQGLSIPPLQMARIIRSLADTSKSLESQGIATLPLTAHDVIIDEKFHARLVNMAISGEPDPSVATQDKQLLGQLLRDLLTPNQPGSTRTDSLLGFMADGHRDQPLSWDQIYELADGIERQLAEPRNKAKIASSTMPMRPLISSATIAKIAIAVATLAIVIGLVYYFSNRKVAPPERQLEDLVRIPAGQYPGPLGTTVTMNEFWIGAHEVTIGEYAKFLNALSVISPEQRAVYQHDDQPEEKTDHLPNDWDSLYAEASAGGQWNGLPVDLNYPVVGIDWWDAYAYAEWKGHRLPTRDEWYGSCSAGADPAKLDGTGWKAVDQTEKTSLGVHGMAGNVSEWTRKAVFDPADPSKPARFILCGASYLKPKYGARAHEWVDDRSLRRPDLGFRTCGVSPERSSEGD
ncbi:SUMF1/EgtB/PvdO family nonheme iron enzyme [Verrucomicrobiaceae bacterium R5-34]|nr:SUMF1/EgtB/PvdO family nonheme iron enzyme [Verrucomicrobiaceae bacterium R5-34]